MVIAYATSLTLTGRNSVSATDYYTVDAIDYIQTDIDHGDADEEVNLSATGNDLVKFIAIIADNYPDEAAPGTPDITYKWSVDTNTEIYLGEQHIYSDGMDLLVDKPITGEAYGVGDAMETHFLHTCANFPVTSGSFSATDTVETFSDNGDGTLTGSAGGSGTIDYSVGDADITFNAAPGLGQAITCAYRTNYASLDKLFFSNAGRSAASDATITIIVGRDT